MQITDRSLIAAVATGFLAAVGACAEPHCPDGFDKIGQICRRSDSGLGTIEAGANVEEDAEQSVQDPVDARTTGTDGVNQDASRDAEAAMANTTECDVNRPCTSGYACAGDKCVSACDLNKCDPSATCALSGAGTACTCNRGYINTSKVSGEVICARDLQCDQLGCHANAACEMASDQLKRCVCNPGYEGDGKICSLVSCPKLTILNGVVSGGNTYGDVATYRCNDGYEADLQNLTRTCLDTGKWSGTAPTCNGVDCGPLLASDNGSVSISAGTRYPATATYSCKSGFRALRESSG